MTLEDKDKLQSQYELALEMKKGSEFLENR